MKMYQLVLLIFFSIFSNQLIAQHGLLKKDGKIFYEETLSFDKMKKKELIEKAVAWVNNDTLFTLGEVNEKSGMVKASSYFFVSTPNKLNRVEYKMMLEAGKNELRYYIVEFYLPEIELTVDQFLELHKGKDNEHILNTIRYLASGLHGKAKLFMKRTKGELSTTGKE